MYAYPMLSDAEAAIPAIIAGVAAGQFTSPAEIQAAYVVEGYILSLIAPLPVANMAAMSPTARKSLLMGSVPSMASFNWQSLLPVLLQLIQAFLAANP